MQDSNLQNAITVLQKDGIIIHPTDTCYGLACSIFSQSALEKLYKIKKMPLIKPVSILVASIKEAEKYGKFDKSAKKLVKKYWPGPLTIIVKRKKTLPGFLNPKIRTIGIRFPDHKFSQQLIKKLSCPVVTTSANLTGEKEPYATKEISKKLKSNLIINNGILPKNPPSTIVDISEGKISIIRQGALKVE